jgi:hypothetical protein
MSSKDNDLRAMSPVLGQLALVPMYSRLKGYWCHSPVNGT